MKPEEKEAKELFNKFIEFTRYWDELDGYMVDKYNAKQCTLIAIEYALQFVGGDIEEEFDKTLYLVTLKNIINDKF